MSPANFDEQFATFLALANFKLDLLTVIQRGETAIGLDFRKMDEKIFAR